MRENLHSIPEEIALETPGERRFPVLAIF